MTPDDVPIETTAEGEATGGAGLPVDPRAIALALWAIRWPLAIGVASSLVIGLALAMIFAKRSYTAETLMLYQAPPEQTPEAATMPSLLTLLNMVKLPSNLETVIAQLDLGVDTRTLGGATKVELQPKTTLVMISASWENARKASEIANALRDTFLQTQTRLRRNDAETRVHDLTTRIDAVSAKMAVAEDKLRAFTKENRVVHLSEEARALLDELSSVNLLYEQARIDKRSTELQAANADRLIKELQDEMAKEQQSQAALSDALSETNIRIQRLRESIMDDRETRANYALLEEARLNLDRATKAHETGAISQEVLGEAVAKLKIIEARAVDSPQVAGWKKEIEVLDSKVIPSGGGSGGVTGNLLKDIMFRSFEIRLQQTTVTERVDALAEARKRVDDRLARLPDLQRTFAQLTRDVSTLEAEAGLLEQRLGEANRLLEASALPFTLVSEAMPPPRSSKSNAKLLAAGVTILLGAIVLGAGVLIAVLDPRIRTRRELEIALRQVTVLCEIPARPESQTPLISDESEDDLTEIYRAAARHLRTLLPQQGARLLVTAPGHGEGTSTIAVNLAAILGRWGERVLLVDANLRDETPGPEAQPRAAGWRGILRIATSKGVLSNGTAGDSPLRGLLKNDPEIGLSHLLEDASLPLSRAVVPTHLMNVSAVVHASRTASPDLLATERFRSLLAEASRSFTIVLVDGPPVLASVDAENVALAVDGIVLVVKAMGPFGMAVRGATEPFARLGKPITGGVLTGVAALYASGASSK